MFSAKLHTFTLLCLTFLFVNIKDSHFINLAAFPFSSSPAENKPATSPLRTKQLLPCHWKFADRQREPSSSVVNLRYQWTREVLHCVPFGREEMLLVRYET